MEWATQKSAKSYTDQVGHLHRCPPWQVFQATFVDPTLNLHKTQLQLGHAKQVRITPSEQVLARKIICGQVRISNGGPIMTNFLPQSKRFWISVVPVPPLKAQPLVHILWTATVIGPRVTLDTARICMKSCC